MHLKPDHDPGTAFISVSGEDIWCSGVRHKVEELVLCCVFLVFFFVGIHLEVQLRADRFTGRDL